MGGHKNFLFRCNHEKKQFILISPGPQGTGTKTRQSFGDCPYLLKKQSRQDTIPAAPQVPNRKKIISQQEL